MRISFLASAVLLLSACPANTEAPQGTEGGTETGGITTASSGAVGDDSTPADDSGSPSDGAADGTAGGSGSDSDTGVGTTVGGESSTGGDATTTTAGTGGPGTPIDCGNTTYACGDGKDNDGDGLTDLQDPECTGPCDDDESSFQTGINGDNVDCKQDCFFDGNSGQGDDGCIWDLKCDPANPGDGTAMPDCSYTGGMNCENMPPNQDKDCIEFCMPFVPPGCDCFGCCVVTDSEGNEASIFLNSPDPECSIDNVEACNECTQSDDCVNTCEDCELCFGQEELPPECDSNECDFGDPCTTVADCPTDWYCLQDCCYPPPPG